MNFKCEVEGLELKIEVNKKDFQSPHRHFLLSKQDQRDLDSGAICFYEIIIHSSKGEETMIHYSPGHAMTIDEEELLDEVEIVLEDAGLIDKVLLHWELETEQGPRWKLKGYK